MHKLVYKCNQCRKEFTDKNNFDKHVEDDHTPKLPTCNKCLSNAENQKKPEAQENNSDEPEILYHTCNLCSYKAHSETDLEVHKHTVHASEVLVLRAVRDLTENVRTLSADIFYLKSNSIIIEKDFFALVKSDNFDKIDQKLEKVTEKLENFSKATKKPETYANIAKDNSGHKKLSSNIPEETPTDRIRTKTNKKSVK